MTSSHTRKWPKLVLGIFVVLLLLIVAVYFLATSGWFIKAVILPKVSDSMNAEITVAEIDLKPFSRVEISGLKVQPHGHEPLVQAKSVTARYDLREILGGNILVHELTLAEPLITLVEDERGSNLEKITGEEKAQEDSEKSRNRLNISNIKITNGKVVSTKTAAGTTDITTINDLNLSIDKVASGGQGNLNLSGLVLHSSSGSETNGSLASTLNGKIGFKLTEDNLPQSASGGITINVNQAEGSFAQANQLQAIIQTDLTPAEIRNLGIKLSRGADSLGELSVSGPFDAEKMEGSLQVALRGIDRDILNLAAASANVDLNKTQISSTNQVDLSNGGKLVRISGKLQAQEFSLTDKEKQQTTPVVNLAADYAAAVNKEAGTTTLERFNLNGSQNGKEFLRGFINNPLAISTNSSGDIPDSSLTVYLTNFALADWKAFAPDLEPSGSINAGLTVNSSKGGNQLDVALNAKINDLSAVVGSNRISNADITTVTRVIITNLNDATLQKLQVVIGRDNNQALSLNATGKINKETQDADLKVNLESSLPQLTSILSITNLNFTNGRVTYIGQVQQEKEKQTVQGQLTITNLAGTVGESTLTGFAARADVDVSKDEDVLDIRTLKGNLAHEGKQSGNFEVSGKLNSAETRGSINFQLNQLNESLLKPFLAGMLGEKQLLQIDVNAQGSAELNGTNDMRLKGEFDVSNFVIKDPEKQQPNPPLAIKLNVNGAQRNQVFELQDTRLTLSPTDRAKNELQIRGMLDMTQSNALKGNIVLSSESLDITPFYDIYASKPGETNAVEKAPDDNPSEEPGPTTLPVQNLTAELNIGRFYLRQVDVNGLQAKAVVQSNRVTLNPVQMTINGAPVNANVNLDLGVKGYGYDVALTMDKVPLEPLALSFADVKPGQYQGQLVADVKVKGIGTSGTNLQQHLTGATMFSFTNANIKLVGPKWRRILVPIATILRVGDVLESPLNWLNARMEFGNGNINLQTASVQSEAFQAAVSGIIPIANELTNSPLRNLPVNFQLRRSLAEKTGLLAPNTPEDAKYSQLPSFVSLTGTIGEPGTDINEVAITGLLLRGGAGFLKGTAGDVLQGVGGLLTGQRPGTNSPAGTTNAPPATNSAPLNPLSPLRDLFRRK